MSTRIIGLDIDEGSVIGTELFKKKGRICLGRSWKSPNLKELRIESYLQGVVINLPTQMVLFRSFPLPPSLFKNKHRAKDIIAFLLAQNLPLKLEECFWDTFILNTTLNLIAAKKEIIEKYIKQVQDSGWKCLGINPSFMALYNVFIYNGPEKDGFAILNIRNSASDLLIYENKRFWIYPISIGKLGLDNAADGLARFPIEVQRILNAHYLQNPLSQKRNVNLTLCGQINNFDNLALSLKNVLGELKIAISEPFKKIEASQRLSLSEQQPMITSLGLGLTYLKPVPCLNINLMKEKIRNEDLSKWRNFAKNAFLSLGVLSIVFLLFFDLSLMRNLKAKNVVYKNTRFLISSVLPEAKILKEEKGRLQKLQGYLERKLEYHKLYLKVLAQISHSKPNYVQIQEVEAKQKDTAILVSLSGSAPTYGEVNVFLANLKKNKDITDVKIVFSSFPSNSAEAISFKLRFQEQ